ncbi:MAG: hypothetical protein FJ315_04615 [SAR202 cluster bacterium]|nr:hypothetical protein [SAR202 cluster bacterium]
MADDSEKVFFASKSDRCDGEHYFIWAKNKQEALEISRQIWPPGGTIWLNEIFKSTEMVPDPKRPDRKVRKPWKRMQHDRFAP